MLLFGFFALLFDRSCSCHPCTAPGPQRAEDGPAQDLSVVLAHRHGGHRRQAAAAVRHRRRARVRQGHPRRRDRGHHRPRQRLAAEQRRRRPVRHRGTADPTSRGVPQPHVLTSPRIPTHPQWLSLSLVRVVRSRRRRSTSASPSAWTCTTRPSRACGTSLGWQLAAYSHTPPLLTACLAVCPAVSARRYPPDAYKKELRAGVKVREGQLVDSHRGHTLFPSPQIC